MAQERTMSISVCSCPSCGFSFIRDEGVDIPDPATSQNFRAFLRCNDSPLQAAMDLLSQQYAEVKDRLTLIAKQLPLLQASSTRLLEEQEKLRRYVEQYKIVLHPIRRLPVEICTSIFMLSVDPPCVDLFNGIMTPDCRRRDSARTPWVLMQVCRRWRDIVISLPTLWTDFFLDLRPCSPSQWYANRTGLSPFPIMPTNTAQPLPTAPINSTQSFLTVPTIRVQPPAPTAPTNAAQPLTAMLSNLGSHFPATMSASNTAHQMPMNNRTARLVPMQHHFPPPLPTRTNTERLSSKLSLLLCQMQYSGIKPITLYLTSNEYLLVENQPLLAAVCSSSYRWKVLRISLPSSGMKMLASVRGALPMLETLHIEDLDDNHPVHNATAVDAFEYAPALRDLVLLGSAATALVHYKLPWKQVRRFFWNFGRYDSHNHTHFQLLSRMPNLASCYMGGVRWSPQTSLSVRNPIQLRFLTVLSLRAVADSISLLPPPARDVPNFGQILENIHAPALQQLTLYGKICQRDMDKLIGLKFHSQYPLLNSVIVNDLDVTSISIISFLSSLPSSLYHISLGSSHGLHDMVIEALQYTPLADTLPLLPKLKYLELGGIKICSDLNVIEMLQSRIIPENGCSSEVSSLQTLFLHLPEKTGYASLLTDPRMMKLLDEGFRIQVIS